jgi:hypothetical protein
MEFSINGSKKRKIFPVHSTRNSSSKKTKNLDKKLMLGKRELRSAKEFRRGLFNMASSSGRLLNRDKMISTSRKKRS